MEDDVVEENDDMRKNFNFGNFQKPDKITPSGS